MNNLDGLDSLLAKKIIDTLGRSGIPPEYGVEYFTVGIDDYLSLLEEEYLKDYIKNGGSSFKLVVGIYGSGKTHFLYCVRNLAWKHGYVISYVTLSQNSCPFTKMELVYKEIIKNIIPPLKKKELMEGYERGIGNFIKRWIGMRYQEYKRNNVEEDEINNYILEELDNWDDIESISFKKAVKKAVEFYLKSKKDEYDNVIQWLQAEGYDSRIHKSYGILERIDKTTAFTMIRSLVQWVRYLGYSGLIVFFDEAEQVPSLGSKDKNAILSNLRELIDECSNLRFSNTMIFYAVPDKNFLEGKTQVYEALNQRLSTFFDISNPAGVEINLENLSIDSFSFLKELGRKLFDIYKIDHKLNFDERKIFSLIDQLAQKVYQERYGDEGYRRRFVKEVISKLEYVRVKNEIPKLDSN